MLRHLTVVLLWDATHMFSACFIVSEPLSIFNKCPPLLYSRCLEIHFCIETKDPVLPASVSLKVKITFQATAVNRMGLCLQIHCHRWAQPLCGNLSLFSQQPVECSWLFCKIYDRFHLPEDFCLDTWEVTPTSPRLFEGYLTTASDGLLCGRGQQTSRQRQHSLRKLYICTAVCCLFWESLWPMVCWKKGSLMPGFGQLSYLRRIIGPSDLIYSFFLRIRTAWTSRHLVKAD